jgi:hypothetical protein
MTTRRSLAWKFLVASGAAWFVLTMATSLYYRYAADVRRPIPATATEFAADVRAGRVAEAWIESGDEYRYVARRGRARVLKVVRGAIDRELQHELRRRNIAVRRVR